MTSMAHMSHGAHHGHNQPGRVSREEFVQSYMQEQQRQQELTKELPPLVPNEELYHNFDFNRNGSIEQEEFTRGMGYLASGGPVGSLVYGKDFRGDPLPAGAKVALAAAGYPTAEPKGPPPGGYGAHTTPYKTAGQRYDDNDGGGYGGYGGNGGGGAPDGYGGYGGGGPAGYGGPGGDGYGPGGYGGGGGGGPGGPGGCGGYGGGVGPDGEEPQRMTSIRVPMRESRYAGSRKFYGDVPVANATFAYSELCATQDPEASLAPVPEVPCKMWYNSYVYMNENRRAIKEGGQFLERFVQGKNGEWYDVPKARRMADHIQEARMRVENEKKESEAIRSGAAWAQSGAGAGGGMGGKTGANLAPGSTAYRDPYSGEKLVVYQGQLLPKEELFAEHNVHKSEWSQALAGIANLVDFDNFRVQWPFGRPYRNKQISNHAYEWFDRQNPYIQSDRQFEMLELPSVFVDKEQYGKWRALEGDSPAELISDVVTRARHIDDYPYHI